MFLINYYFQKKNFFRLLFGVGVSNQSASTLSVTCIVLAVTQIIIICFILYKNRARFTSNRSNSGERSLLFFPYQSNFYGTNNRRVASSVSRQPIIVSVR